MILFVNACVREQSRTERLAEHLIKAIGMPVSELRLGDCVFPPVDETFLKERDLLIAEKKFDDPMFEPARRFSEAEEIIIAAPFWDLSFPAVLKQYFEQINVVGITFRYNSKGIPEGLCRAKKLYYVTTVGGDFFPEIYGAGYVKAMAQSFYGIEDVELIAATGLDIEGADVEKILKNCEEEIDRKYFEHP